MPTQDSLSRFAALPMPVDAELGRCTMAVREILSLGPGSVIKLSNAVGSRIGLRVGGAPFGSGEIVKAGPGIAIKIKSFSTTKGE